MASIAISTRIIGGSVDTAFTGGDATNPKSSEVRKRPLAGLAAFRAGEPTRSNGRFFRPPTIAGTPGLGRVPWTTHRRLMCAATGRPRAGSRFVATASCRAVAVQSGPQAVKGIDWRTNSRYPST